MTTWPPGTFVENLAPLPDGDFVVSLHSRRELARVGRDGSRSTLAHLPVSPVGIVVDGDRLVVGGGEIGTTPHTVFTVGLDGHVQPLVEVPDSLFLNGFTPARAGPCIASTPCSARSSRSTWPRRAHASCSATTCSARSPPTR